MLSILLYLGKELCVLGCKKYLNVAAGTTNFSVYNSCSYFVYKGEIMKIDEDEKYIITGGRIKKISDYCDNNNNEKEWEFLDIVDVQNQIMPDNPAPIFVESEMDEKNINHVG